MAESILKDFKWSSLMTDSLMTNKSQSFEYDLERDSYEIFSEMLDFEPCLISLTIDNGQIKLSGSISFSLNEDVETEEYPSDLYDNEAKIFFDDLESFLKEKYDGGFVVLLSNNCLLCEALLTEK